MSHGITHDDKMFSVRSMPWHGLGVVLDEHPRSIDDALGKAGLGWKVTHGDVLVVKTPEWTDDFGRKHPRRTRASEGLQGQPARGHRRRARDRVRRVRGLSPVARYPKETAPDGGKRCRCGLYVMFDCA